MLLHSLLGKESKTEEWTDVSKMFEQKSRLQNEAEVAYQQAKFVLCRVFGYLGL